MQTKLDKLLRRFIELSDFSLNYFIKSLKLRFGHSSRVSSALKNLQVFLLFLRYDLVEPFQICKCNRVYSYLTCKSKGMEEKYSNSSEFHKRCSCGKRIYFFNLFFANSSLRTSDPLNFLLILYLISLKVSLSNIQTLTGKSIKFINSVFNFMFLFSNSYNNFFFNQNFSFNHVVGPVGADHFVYKKNIFFILKFHCSRQVRFFSVLNYKSSSFSSYIFNLVPSYRNIKIITDCAPTFKFLTQFYSHIALNHSRGQYWTPEGSTNPTESEIGQLKNFLEYVDNMDVLAEAVHFWETFRNSKLGVPKFFDFIFFNLKIFNKKVINYKKITKGFNFYPLDLKPLVNNLNKFNFYIFFREINYYCHNNSPFSCFFFPRNINQTFSFLTFMENDIGELREEIVIIVKLIFLNFTLKSNSSLTGLSLYKIKKVNARFTSFLNNQLSYYQEFYLFTKIFQHFKKNFFNR